MKNYLHLCFKLWLSAGLRHIVISPGSRSAPLVRAVVESNDFETLVIPDERSAAFIALGIAQASNQPVAMICTSGTAVYNYAPAVAEAFFTNTSLLILSADRPPEWINQDDGQTIYQKDIFGKHVVGSFQFPVSVESEHDYLICSRIAKEAMNIITRGPVHINCPFREPLYMDVKDVEKTYVAPKQWFEWRPALIKDDALELKKEHFNFLNNSKKILIIIGKKDKDTDFIQYLKELKKYKNIVCIADIVSNCHGIFPHYVINSKNLECHSKNKNLIPDLLITFGRSLLSKPLKMWLRHVNIENHWIFNAESEVAKDTFNSRYTHFKVRDAVGMRTIINMIKNHKYIGKNYCSEWNNFVITNDNKRHNKDLCLVDKNVVLALLSSLPNDYHLHIGNSMPIRYISALGCFNDTVTIYSNRGTCGIDGSVSTAMGHAIANEGKHLLVVGDMSFFYDRNAWWHKHIPKQFKVLIINNFGGGIFDLIVKNTSDEVKKKYFVTEQNMRAAHLASEFNIDYCLVKNMDNYHVLLDRIRVWINDKKNKLSIMEIQTNNNNPLGAGVL